MDDASEAGAGAPSAGVPDGALARLPKPASPSTVAHQAGVRAALDLDDPADEARATRGRVAGPASPQVTNSSGGAVWDLAAFDFLDGDAPDTVNPSLWRQARLNRIAGLFEVAAGVHQVRGLDLANITFVAGDTGWVVIDPLTSAETARAALDLANAHLGERPVRAVIYTHSHVDHFAGVRGVVDEAAVRAGEVRILAPAGFLDAAIAENVIAGNVMGRRASYMYGALLPRGPHGHVDAGIGKGIPTFGSAGLLAPTEEVDEDGAELTIDGVRFAFHLVPDTEAPAEMNFLLPDHRVLCVAENCTATLHNLYTPRGAQIRDALAWSAALHETLERFRGRADVLMCCHNWPRWGDEDIEGHLARQRDAYRFLHDQTMRLANHGLTATEIAERLELPEALRRDFGLRSYYGTVNHNAKAVYQRYLGWFDGNPARLHPLPPEAAARRYVDYMGGPDAVVVRARADADAGEYRWAAQVLDHVVFAEPDHDGARVLLADVLEQLGYQAESAPWRDFYLTGAQELRHGTLRGIVGPAGTVSEDVVAAMTVEMLLQLLGVRLDGPAAAELAVDLDLEVPDRDERWRLGVANGALHHARSDARSDGTPDSTTDERPAPPLVVRIDHAPLAALVRGDRTLDDLLADGSVAIEGDDAPLRAVLDHLDTFEFWFDIVTP